MTRSSVFGAIIYLLGTFAITMAVRSLIAQDEPTRPSDPFAAPQEAPAVPGRKHDPADPFSAPRAATNAGRRPPAQAADPFAAPTAATTSGRRAPPPATAGAASGRLRRVEAPISSRSRIEQELGRMTDLDVVEMPLKDVVTYLQEKHQIPIVLATKKLEEASVAPDTAVTKSLRGITLAAALDLTLKDLGLDWYVNEVLVITTPQDAAAQAEVRTYDCRGLLGADGQDETADRAARLMTMIQTAVEPDSWRGSAADMTSQGTHSGRRTLPLPAIGSVTEFDGILAVSQTAKTHRKIQQLLSMLAEPAGVPPIRGKVVE